MSGLALIHPPGGDPRSPRLALPALQAYLRQQSVDVRVVDLDILSLEAVLRRESLERAARVVHGRATPVSSAAFDRLAVLAERLPETVPLALATIRSPDQFFDRTALATAQAVLLDGLDLLSAACPRPVHYTLQPTRYDVDGVDATRLPDLLKVTADRGANLFADYWEETILPDLERVDFDLIGVSLALRCQLIPGLTLARRLRERGHFVVLGGSLIPRFARRLAELPEFFEAFADGIVVGDGETALGELVAQLRGRRDFGKVPNYLYRESSGLRFSRTHVEDLSRLPTPDFTGMPLDAYLAPERVLPILIGRGCYHSLCRFCEIPHNQRVSSQPFRLRPPALVVEDILRTADAWSCRHFVIGDEAIQPNVFEEIADGLVAARREDLRFEAYLRFEPGFTAPLCRKLAGVGLRRVLLGLESGCQRTLDHMRKGMRVEDARPVLEALHAAGIHFGVFAIVGLPEEEEDSARDTFSFFERNADLFDHPGSHFDIRPLSLQVSTPYMEAAAALGLQIPKDLLAGDFVVGVGRHWENTRGLSQQEITQVLKEGHARLARVYDRYDFFPSAIWPVWDEWGLLYADHYHDRSYPYRSSLPAVADVEFGVRWNPALAVLEDGDVVVVASRSATLRLPKPFHALFDHGDTLTRETLLNRVTGEHSPASSVADEVRATLATLSRAGLLQIVPAPPASNAPDPAAADGR